MEGKNSWNVVSNNDKTSAKPLMAQHINYSDNNYASTSNYAKYENVNKTSQVTLKRQQSFNTSTHQPSYKRPNMRTSYLSDKRNQFNLTSLKGEPADEQPNINSESTTNSTTGGTNYYWTPNDNDTNYQWTPNYQWNETNRNNFQDTSKRNIKTSQENNLSGLDNVRYVNSTNDGKPDSTGKSNLSQKQSSALGSTGKSNQLSTQGKNNDSDKQLSNETTKEKETTGRDLNLMSRIDSREINNQYDGSSNVRRTGWDNMDGGGRKTSNEFQRDGNYSGSMYGVNQKYGGKFRKEHGIDDRSVPPQGNWRFDANNRNEKIGSNERFYIQPDERRFMNENTSVMSNRGAYDRRQQSPFDGNRNTERPNNQHDKPGTTYGNNPVSNKNTTEENNESNEKDLSDKERIKQMLIDHANKSVLINQTQPINTLANILLNALNPVNTPANSTTSTAVNSTVDPAKPPSTVTSTVTTSTNNNTAKPLSVEKSVKATSTVTSTNCIANTETSTTSTITTTVYTVKPSKPDVNTSTTTVVASSTTPTNNTSHVNSNANRRHGDNRKHFTKSHNNTGINKSAANSIVDVPSLMNAPIRSHAQTNAPIRSHAQTNAPIRSHAQTNAPIRSHAQTNAPIRSHAQTNAPIRSHAQTNAPIRSHAQTNVPIRSHAQTNARNSNMNTNIIQSALSSAKPTRSHSYLLSNPVAKPMNPALNPVINAALQLMPGTSHPLARANPTLLMGLNRMPSIFRHPVLNNIRIPRNQFGNQSLRQNNVPNNISNRMHNFPRSMSQGRFR